MSYKSPPDSWRATVFVSVVIIIITIAAYGAAVINTPQAGTTFDSIGKVAVALQHDTRFIKAENGSSYVFDSNDSGVLPSSVIIGGTETIAANLIFYRYGEGSIAPCGLSPTPIVDGEIEVRVPYSGNQYELHSILIYRYLPPFVYVCQKLTVFPGDVRMEFHIQINYSGSWQAYYEFNDFAHPTSQGKVDWSGTGPASITVEAIGDPYAGVFVCAGAWKADNAGGELALLMYSFNRDIQANSTFGDSQITVCGGEKVLPPL